MDYMTASITGENTAELKKYFEAHTKLADRNMSAETKAVIKRVEGRLSKFSGSLSSSEVRIIRSRQGNLFSSQTITKIETAEDIALSTKAVKTALAVSSTTSLALLKAGTFNLGKAPNRETVKYIRTRMTNSITTVKLGGVITNTEQSKVPKGWKVYQDYNDADYANLRAAESVMNESLANGTNPFNLDQLL